MKPLNLKKLASFVILAFLTINLLCWAALSQKKSATTDDLIEIVVKKNQLLQVTSKMIDRDQHLFGTVEKEIFQEAMDFSQAQSWLPLASYLEMNSIQSQIRMTSFATDYLTCKYEVTCSFNGED